MPNEIYHRSNWGNANAGEFGDVYFDAATTNKLYNHSDYYENSDGTDKTLRDLPNKASIALTPTAYSNGSLNTVIPPYQVLQQELVTNGDFATDSDWTKETGWTISGGKANKEGATASNFYQPVFTSGKKYRLTFDISNSNDGRLLIYFGSAVSEDILSASDGTYSFDNVANNDTLIFRNVNWTGSIDNVSVKEIQEADFDFSRGSSATRVNEKGLIESIASGLPRIDYTSGFGSLLLEPQSTNLVPYSEDFSQWDTTQNATLTSDSTISPDGSVNATKITDNSTNGNHRVFTSLTTTSGSNTFSVYLKKGTMTTAFLRFLSGSDIATANVNLEEGTITATTGTAEIQNAGNDWYRCSITGIATAGTSYVYIYMKQLSAYSGTSQDLFLWGAQLEAGSYATSYIVSNSGSATTRSADVANNSGNADLFNDSEGVLYAEISALANDGSYRFLGISDGTTTNRVKIMFNNNDTLDAFIGGVGTFDSDANILDFNKAAIKYKSGDYAFWVNGFEVEVSTSTSGLHSGLNTLNFDIGNGSNDFYGKVKELAVFKEALTDAELESLTSWVSFTEMATDLEYTLE